MRGVVLPSSFKFCLHSVVNFKTTAAECFRQKVLYRPSASVVVSAKAKFKWTWMKCKAYVIFTIPTCIESCGLPKSQAPCLKSILTERSVFAYALDISQHFRNGHQEDTDSSHLTEHLLYIILRPGLVTLVARNIQSVLYV